MAAQNSIGVGLLGLGTVGGAVAGALVERADGLARKAGCPLHLEGVLVRDLSKRRASNFPAGCLTSDPGAVLDNPRVRVVVEVMGGERPAAEHIRRALESGRHVVTANKEVMAKHGPDLLAVAQRKGVYLLFEASVGGGIPIIGPLMQDLLANQVRSVHAIINGTTNFILTRMAQQGTDFAVALKEAQALGYAEPDPTNDVEGIDATYKLCILSSLAFHARVPFESVYHEGITQLRAKDFRYARELGYAIKLLAIAGTRDGQVQARVHPVFVPQDHLLAKVDGAFNAIEVEGDLVGRVVFHGLGAGPQPTSSAVLGDLLEIARRINSGGRPAPAVPPDGGLTVQPMSEVRTRYYIRLNVLDKPGVLARIAHVLGEHNISIASVIQKDADTAAGTAELVIMTHPAQEDALQSAVRLFKGLDVVGTVDNVVRVEDWPAAGQA